ncbi:uncharacterized protein LOC115928319 [Strongylocentrotus purpuratus]|uniref:Uncharacterized protein n=1 Tax=Strongylocentrotus purpuratus TaxID=7668 RepID=A0A7M7PH78_STRPU|nr:uncharacterized protein LOC115928319 [Strongylocentrotus purpuratus]
MNPGNFIYILLFTAAVNSCRSEHSQQEITSYVQKNVTLSYNIHVPTDVNECTFHVEYDNVIFYKNGTFIKSENYALGKQKRSQLKATRVFQSFQVTLELHRLHEFDAGVYGCCIQCEESHSSQSYLLLINHPPKPADCIWIDTPPNPYLDLGSYNLSILYCKAINGHPTSGIICFSQDKQKTSVHAPKHLTGVDIIEATFVLSMNADIRCCSISSLYQQNWDSCNDFNALSTSHQPQSTLKSRLSKEVNDSKIVITTAYEEKTTKSTITKSVSNTSSVIDSPSILVSIIVVFVVRYCCIIGIVFM